MEFKNPFNVAVYIVFLFYLGFLIYQLTEMKRIGFNSDIDYEIDDMGMLTLKVAFWNSLILTGLIIFFTIKYYSKAGVTGYTSPIEKMFASLFIGYLIFYGVQLSRMYKLGFEIDVDTNGKYKLSSEDKVTIQFSFINTILFLYITMCFIFILKGTINPSIESPRVDFNIQNALSTSTSESTKLLSPEQLSVESDKDEQTTQKVEPKKSFWDRFKKSPLEDVDKKLANAQKILDKALEKQREADKNGNNPKIDESVRKAQIEKNTLTIEKKKLLAGIQKEKEEQKQKIREQEDRIKSFNIGLKYLQKQE